MTYSYCVLHLNISNGFYICKESKNNVFAIIKKYNRYAYIAIA